MEREGGGGQEERMRNKKRGNHRGKGEDRTGLKEIMHKEEKGKGRDWRGRVRGEEGSVEREEGGGYGWEWERRCEEEEIEGEKGRRRGVKKEKRRMRGVRKEEKKGGTRIERK